MSVRNVLKSTKNAKRRRTPQEDMTRALGDVALDEAGAEDAEYDADLYDYLVYLEENEEEKREWLEHEEWVEQMEKEDYERRRTTCTCEKYDADSDADYDDECVADVCKCICYNGSFSTCRARIHVCACHRDFHSMCMAHEHKCVCEQWVCYGYGRILWRGTCPDFCDYPPAMMVELVCKLHTCICPSNCVMRVHNCICTSHSPRCCAAEEGNHNCTCENDATLCRASGMHRCTCSWNPKRCRASDMHGCVCEYGRPEGCKSTEHYCIGPEKKGMAPSCKVMIELLKLAIPYTAALNIHDNLVVKGQMRWGW